MARYCGGCLMWLVLLLTGCGGTSAVNPAPVYGDGSLGAQTYEKQCATCHGLEGKGIAGSFPALTHDKCDICDDWRTLRDTVAASMPVGGKLCTGTCADDVAAFIVETFTPPVVSANCRVQSAPIRRLTRFEYSNALHDLLGDASRPGNRLPSEELGNGFGNDANALSVSNFLAEQYSKVADDVASATLADSVRRDRLGSCLNTLNSFNESACIDSVVDSLLRKAFRRPPTDEELSAYTALFDELRTANELDFALAGTVSAVLQAPEFLYRVEAGQLDESTGRMKPTAYEMASRLSFFLWGSIPDEQLLLAAQQGRLDSAADVRREAERMLEDAKSRSMLEYFFDSLLPISSLRDLERDHELFPTFSAEIGALMRQEIHALIQHVIFEGAGDWQSILTSDYTFVNSELADFYGMAGSGIYGDELQLVNLNSSQRRGILTSAGIMAGTTHSVKTNPVARGAYIMKKMLCTEIPLPTGDIAELVVPPNPDSGLTARDRYSAHSSEAVCAECHKLMDPVGLVFEQFDPVGLFRTHENGVLIDASGELPGAGIPVDNAVQMVNAIAQDDRTYQCFAHNWANFAYGKSISGKETCLQDEISQVFEREGYDIPSLLIGLTQTDAFLYLPDSHGAN